MKASQLTKENITPEIVDKLLFEGLDYKGETADVIIVLGSRKACDYRVPLAAKLLSGTDTKVCCVVGFPLGACLSEAKAAETRLAVQAGAEEVDMVIWQNIKPCSSPPKNAAYRPPP